MMLCKPGTPRRVASGADVGVSLRSPATMTESGSATNRVSGKRCRLDCETEAIVPPQPITAIRGKRCITIASRRQLIRPQRQREGSGEERQKTQLNRSSRRPPAFCCNPAHHIPGHGCGSVEARHEYPRRAACESAAQRFHVVASEIDIDDAAHDDAPAE